jgi:hypothetical protein
MMWDLTRFPILLVALSCNAALFGLFVFLLSSLASLTTVTTPEPTPGLLPADHGLPDTIAGYRIRSVRTSETTRCIPPGTAFVTIEVEALTVDEALATTDWRTVRSELERLHPEIRWQIAIAGPGGNIEAGIAGNDRWNAVFANRPCLRLGGPIGPPVAIIPAATEVAE